MREKILISLFFIIIFINFLGPIVDPDFPFHLKTGEYLYQHKEIPRDDPFSFYGKGIVTDRERLMLSQYWIVQIIFYKLYSMIGPAGVILLRAAVLSAFVFLLWFTLRKRGLYSSLIIASLVTILFQAVKVDRPQFFSFLFTLIFILLIERFRKRPDSAMPLYFIPPLMLLWANMHGGFVFGVAVIVIYTITETLKFFINKPNLIGNPLDKKTLLIFLAIMLSTILVSYINPATNGQIIVTFESHTKAKKIYMDIREYISPIEEMSAYFGLRSSVIPFWILFGFISIIVTLNILRTKSIDITNLAIILFSSVAALTAVRYMPFFIAAALPLSKEYSFFNDKDFFRRLRDSSITFFSFLILFIFAADFGLKDYQNMFRVGHPVHYAEGAANFLSANHINANMFNQFNKGSYLIWRLYPYYKVFSDTRFISLEAVFDTDVISYALEDYKEPLNLGLGNALSSLVPEELGRINVSSVEYQKKPIKNMPLWKRLLEQYKIDLIVHEACSDVKKRLYPLTLRLLKDDDWVLIYLDGTIQIFIRDKKEYSKIIDKFRLSKELIYTEIMLETAPMVTKKVPISTPYSSLALALMMKGKEENARKMIEAALELNGDDLVANFCNAYLALKQKARKKLL